MLLPRCVDDIDDDALRLAYPWPEGGTWLRATMVNAVDGRTQGPDGLSKSLATAADSRVFGLLRSRADAILVGAATIRAERYQPSRERAEVAPIRAAAGQLPAPVVAIVTRSLDLDFALPLFHESAVTPIIITCSTAPAAALARAREVVEVVMCGTESVDLVAARDLLAQRGLTRILSEGGADLLGGLISVGLLDELDLTISPALAGGAGPGIVTGLAPGLLDLDLAHLLEEDGTLLLRYLLHRRPPPG